MGTSTQSCPLALLMVGIVSILALNSGSDAFDDRRLLESSSHGAQFELLHWANPRAPHFVPGPNFVEKFKLSIQSGNARVAAFSGVTQGPPQNITSAPSPTEAPAPSTSYYSPLFNLVFEYGMDITIGTPPSEIFCRR